MDAALAVKTSLHEYLCASVAEADKDKNKEILDKHFPGIEVVEIVDEMTKTIAEANADADDFTKLKMEQLYRRSRLRHSLALLSNETKIAEGVVKAMGGSCSVFKADMDKFDQLIKVELKAALQKAQEVENHWIIFHSGPDFRWCEFLEPFNTLSDDNKRIVYQDGSV